jgi:autotransporter-associated beta strand protein
LILNGTNSYSGTFNVDTSSTTTSDGIVRITRSQNLASAASPIMIRNNNGGSSTLGLDGTLGSVTITQDISLAGRNTNVVAIANYAGSNTISGNLILTIGGANYWLDSDSGTLNFTGMLPASAAVTSSRTFTFMGAGNIIVSGVITNAGTNTVNVVKTNAGTLTLSGANTYRGTTTVSGGSLFVNGSLGTNSVNVAAGLLGGNGTIGGPLVVQSGATLSPGSGLATLTVSNSVTLQSGSTTLMEIRKTPFGNDQLVVGGALALGGNLLVNNLGGTLNAGDSFTLFRAASLGNAFSSLSLPPLNFGLAWNTNALGSGVLSVMSTVPPSTTNITQLPDGSVQLVGVGLPGVTYQLLASTNLNPPGAWVTVTNALANAGGVFQFNDPQAATFSQRFYRVVGP